MMIRTVLLAIAATSAISTAAFATPNAHNTNHPSSRAQMSDRCAALESQYDRTIEGQPVSAKVDKASGLHAQGVDQCNINESDLGVQKLEQALRVLGVRPTA